MGDPLSNRDIVVYATARWLGTNRVNSHHVALELARDNRVLFVESTGMRRLHAGDAGIIAGRIARGLTRRSTFTASTAGLDRVQVLGPLLPPTRHVHGPVAALSRAMLRRQVAAEMRRLGFQSPILWSFHPFGGDLAATGRWAAVVYHCVDDYAEAPGVCAACVRAAERDLVSRADVVFTTADGIPAGRDGATVHPMPNHAVDADLFDPGRRLARPADLADIAGPIVGYAGNVAAYKLDLDLVTLVAAANPAWTFVFVGPVGHGEPQTGLGDLGRLPNVRLLGRRPYQEVPAYLAAFDAAWVPFRVTPINSASMPMKFFEYLAMGRPVVATDLPSLRPYAGAYRAAATPEAMSAALRDALSESSDPRLAAGRSRLGRSHSWRDHAASMTSLVADCLGPGGRQAAAGRA